MQLKKRVARVYHGAVERDEKRAVKEKTISVDCRSDSAADGRARDEKMKRVGREQWRETKEKKKEPRTEKHSCLGSRV